MEDLPSLCELLGLLFAQEAEFAPDVTAQRRGLEMILKTPSSGRIYIAREDGVVIAMANLLFTVSTALGARVALLEDVIVTPEHRGKGVARALIAHVKREAASHGCRRLTLLTDADNEAGQRLYKACGFTHSTMRPMRLSLAD